MSRLISGGRAVVQGAGREDGTARAKALRQARAGPLSEGGQARAVTAGEGSGDP